LETAGKDWCSCTFPLFAKHCILTNNFHAVPAIEFRLHQHGAEALHTFALDSSQQPRVLQGYFYLKYIYTTFINIMQVVFYNFITKKIQKRSMEKEYYLQTRLI
jgi:hypothetical protein